MKKHLLLLSGLLLIISACSKKHDPPVPTSDNIKTITPEKDTLNVFLGVARKINITTDPAGYSRALLKWTSSDTSVLSVDTGGTVTAKKLGISTVKIANKTNTVSASCIITVGPMPVIDSLKYGLIAWYKFDGNTADSSGHGNNGIENLDLRKTPDRFGVANKAYQFNGNTSYVRVKDTAALRLSNTDFTINIWCNLIEYIQQNESDLLSKTGVGGWVNDITGFGHYVYRPGTSPQPPVRSYGNLAFGDLSVALFPGDPTVSAGAWHMLTTVYKLDTKTIYFYVDGALKFSALVDSPMPSTEDMYIGKSNPVPNTRPFYCFKGSIDDIKIYTQALTVSNINELYHLTH